MWGWTRDDRIPPVQPEDDEILVYDWNNASVPRPAGTAKLVESPLLAARKFRASQPQRVATNSFSDYNYRLEEMPLRQFTADTSNGFGVNPYFDNRFSYSNGSMHYRTGEFYFNPQTTKSVYSQSLHPNFDNGSGDSWGWGSNRTFAESQQGRNTSREIAHEDDDDWCNIEEIDYSEKNRQPSQPLDNGNSNIVAETTVATDSSILCVPKPNLPLNEVLSKMSHKSVGLSTASDSKRGSRKRPRNDLDKKKSADLENLLCKTKHRMSARSYAKPTRRVGSSTSSSTSSENSSNTRQSQLSSVLHDTSDDRTTSSALAVSSYQLNGYKNNLENSVPLDPVTSNSTTVDTSIDVMNNIDFESEPEVELKLKIRTDIFEDDDE